MLYSYFIIDNADQGKFEVLGMLSGAIQLVKMHEEKGNI